MEPKDDCLKTSYFQTKTRMLEIVQESLRIKLEVNSIKEAFLNVLQMQDTFESSGRLPKIKTSADEESSLPASRARVRAMYEARKARLRARNAYKRDKENTDPEMEEKIAKTPSNRKCTCSASKISTNGRLTPIREERQNNNNVVGYREKNYYSDGEYVQLKPPGIPSNDYVNIRTENADGAAEESSLWNCSPASALRTKYATSDAINQMYLSPNSTLPSLHEISDISRSSVDRNTYPLHSTLNYPLHSTLISENRTTVADNCKKRLEEDESVKTLDKAAIRSDSFSGSSTSRSSSSGSAAPGLCKEHGLHPTFGGPCIFEHIRPNNSDDADDEREDALENNKLLVPTDYDSSYLSECADTEDHLSDHHDVIHVYDSTVARMRVLRRQTGQTSLGGHPRGMIGLSESDLFESSKASKSSVNATRDSKEPQRPLSIATTTSNTDSPESNQSPIAPVNSPNVTDSGSSRPTTDNYEYFDVEQATFNTIPHIARKILKYDKLNGNLCQRIKRDEHGQFRVPEIPTVRRKPRRSESTWTREDEDHIYFYDKHGLPKTALRQNNDKRLPKRRKREIRKRLELFNSNLHQMTSANFSIKVLGEV